MVERERTIPRGIGILGVLYRPRTIHRREVRSMDQLIPSLAALVEPFRDCFHPSVFATFQALLAGWIVCLGPRTLAGPQPLTARWFNPRSIARSSGYRVS